MPTHPNKAAVLDALRRRIADDLAALVASQHESQAGVTHEEARPENDKDTRAVESSYLARGLAGRVVELANAAASLENLAPRAFDDETPLGLGALVALADEQGTEKRYFLAPAGGGLTVWVDGASVLIVTPQSPVGRALVAKRVGEELEVHTPKGAKSFVITAVS